MATTFLLVLACAICSVGARVFGGCPLINYGGNCYPGSVCPPGTVEGIQTHLSFRVCIGERICCTGTPVNCGNYENCGVVAPTGRLARSQNELVKGSPWQASIRRVAFPANGYTLNNSLHSSGGVLVQDRWVLTDAMAALWAGQRIPGESLLTNAIVVLGDYNIDVQDVNSNGIQEQIRRVKSVTFHPGFRYSNTYSYFEILQDAGASSSFYQANGFCLLELDAPVDFNDYVRPACLPPVDLSCVGAENCKVTGWGADENERVRKELQVVYLDYFSQAACEVIDYYRNGTTVFPTNTKCGANSQSSYSCVGDFGGPLVCSDPNDNNRGVLQGIMTFQRTCRNSKSVLVSDVPNVVSWVWDTCRAAAAK